MTPATGGPEAGVPVRVGLAGLGSMGRNHLRILSARPDVHLVAVADPVDEVLRNAADQCGARAFAEPGAMVAEVELDALVIAAPTNAHVPLALAAIERGIAVLVEKPLAGTIGEAMKIVAAARQHGVPVQVGHVERFNPAWIAARTAVSVPKFIEAHRLALFQPRSLDIDVVFDLMIHDIDIVLELAASPLARLDAVGSHVLGRHVDIANARLTFENGCVANITASRVSFEPVRRTKVFADEAFLSLDFATRRAFVVRMAPGFDKGSLSAEAATRFPPKGSFREFVQQGLMDLREIDMDETNPLLTELTAFVTAVRGARGEPDAAPGAPRGVSAEAGLRAMEVALRISESIEGHRWS